MVARPQVVADAEQVLALQALAQSNRRDEADRARAVLLSINGWTSERLSVVFGVGADSVRRWRSPAKGDWAVAVAEEVLTAPVEDRPNWTLPRLQDEIEKRTEVRISKSRLSVVLRKKGGSAGDAPGTASKAARMPTRSSGPGCGSNS